MEIKNKPFAEIIESSCTKYLAQTWNPQQSPRLGNLVEAKTNDTKILGIITSIKTGSQDPMRYPFTYQKTEDELKKEQPQIFEFLKTTFDVQIVGCVPVCHAELVSVSQSLFNQTINYSLPSSPPKIHSFVKNADIQTIKNFFSKTDFLSLLFNAQIINLDELLLAMLNNIQTTNKELLNKNFLSKFAQDFSLLSDNDYKRLKLFLKRIQQI